MLFTYRFYKNNEMRVVKIIVLIICSKVKRYVGMWLFEIIYKAVNDHFSELKCTYRYGSNELTVGTDKR